MTNNNYDTTVWNGTTEFEVIMELAYGERSAIVLKRKCDNTYVVGKNYSIDGDQVSWSWGCYDIKSASSAILVARKWCFAQLEQD